MSLALFLACLSAAPTSESIAARLASFRMPDTCDYRMTTTVEGPGLSVVARAHVIQAGAERTWTEVESGGRRLRVVREGDAVRVTDMASGQTSETPAGAGVGGPVGMDGLGSVEWLSPRSLGGGRWELREKGGTGRRLVWSEDRAELEVLSMVGESGDSLHTEFGWTTVVGRKVPATMVVRAGAMTTRIEFTAWSFPRTIPASLFSAR